MKKIQINASKEIQINGLKAKQISILINHYAQLRKRAAEDEDVSMALSGLIYLFNESQKERGILNLMIPQMIATFYDELLALLKDLTELSVQEIEDLELTTLMEIIGAYLEETDFESLIKLLGKFSTQLQVFKK